MTFVFRVAQVINRPQSAEVGMMYFLISSNENKVCLFNFVCDAVLIDDLGVA
jgi:hypothetical protein